MEQPAQPASWPGAVALHDAHAFDVKAHVHLFVAQKLGTNSLQQRAARGGVYGSIVDLFNQFSRKQDRRQRFEPHQTTQATEDKVGPGMLNSGSACLLEIALERGRVPVLLSKEESNSLNIVWIAYTLRIVRSALEPLFSI